MSGHTAMFASPLAAIAVAVSACLAGCAPSAASASRPGVAAGGPRRIVVTTGMVGDLVRAVVGEECQVTALMGPGVDPHLYKPTRYDVKLLLDADVVFYSGLTLEGRMIEAFTNLERSGKPVFAVTGALDHSLLRKVGESSNHWDPHVWMDVDLWRQCLAFIADRLSELDPEHAEGYRQRAAAYADRLADLDRRIAAAIQSIPPRQRVLITAHDAFGYFSQRYGIPVRSVQGVTTESEAGVGDVNDLVDFVVSQRVPAIFVESSINPKTIQAVQEGAEAKGWDVQIGAELYSDAMGPAGTYEGTYIGMMDANATRIAAALGGDVKPTGLYGKLTPEPHTNRG